AVGMQPDEMDRDWCTKTDDVFARFEDEHPVAVGEIGIDLYHDRTYRFEQMDAFGYQLDLAMSMRKPVIIHCREALDEVLEVIGGMGDGLPPLVFHSFTYGPEQAERVLRLPDTVIGINGVVTFKNAPDVREAVALAGIGRVVLETDSPYLAPVPKRGRTNESSYLPYIRDKVAEVCGVTAPEAEQATDATARKIFRLPT
ncbi:MAG: TatD family hydrolase, partial [Muribaculaceae bacterium]|nr:TatD family hydrolase [Muribaculaceae bacterium]